MKSYLAVAISIWVILEPSLAAGLSFDLGTANETTYFDLLEDVRGEVRDSRIEYGGTNVPVTAAPTNPVRYLLVNLTASDGEVITIALKKENLYLDGYLDKFNGKFRAHFFSDAPLYAKTNLFPEAKGAANRLDMRYKGQYLEIERNAGDRSKIGLGVKQLNKFIKLVYGKPRNIKEEAQLMLIIIQTISEAARFKYIQNFILADFDSFYNLPDPITIKLETSWDKISNAIKTSNNGVISPDLQLFDAYGNVCNVSNVDYIANHMGILLFIPDRQHLLSTELPFIRLFGINGYYGNAGIHNLRNSECSW